MIPAQKMVRPSESAARRSDVLQQSTKLGIAPEKVRVICPYVGGDFGCKGSTAVIARHGGQPIEATMDAKPGDEKKKYERVRDLLITLDKVMV
ncbi:molybdopterin-dependent oxidoreductase [Glaciimonas sp. PCH181]|uniref:molybdopterin-dependent oxidoreductase n=1 Tax=Glaciimonas sp. PCH181 TaxID=2133943 RepID=UPI000D47B7BB|nr:molybdopterin-dependent oxidoreductase [Glaciimonas sp. PCH181]PUA18858.1 hypothetical protein C7W93_02780 [Glaciimonas sp. PCH181]